MYYAFPAPGFTLARPGGRPGQQLLPRAAVALTEAQYQQLLAAPGSLSLINGAVVPTPPPDPAAVRRAQLALIKAGYDAELLPYVSGYPRFEIDTFPYQDAEAAAWVAWADGPNPDPAAEPATPRLDLIAAERGVARETLIRRAHTKARLYEQVVMPATGKRQRLEDQLDAILAAHQLPPDDPAHLPAEEAVAQMRAVVW